MLGSVSVPDNETSGTSGATCGFVPRPSAAACAARRDRIAREIPGDVLVLHGGDLKTRSADTEFRFRPDSDFYYLTGLAEPGAVMVLRPGHDPAFSLFVRPRDPEAEVWSGRRLGPEGAREAFGADAAHPIAELSEHLPGLLDGAERVHLPLGGPSRITRAVDRAIALLRRRNRTGQMPPAVLVDARVTVGEDRVIKDPPALASLRRAVDLTVLAHLEAMRTVRPGMYEYEIEALLEYTFRRCGGAGPGYGSIVGAGDNATVLHYVANDGKLRAGDLLLIDAGAEWDLHSGDVTRTFPIDGRFRPAQRDLYDIVLRANRAGIEQAVVGSTIETIHERCVRILCEGLLDLGLLEGDIDRVVADESYKKYYMHRTSHWLGADVHDAGYYCLARDPRPLVPGVVLTVEPGLYVAADDATAPAELRGTGVRIEDDVLVRVDGPEVLSYRAPKDPAELEAIIGQHR
jgi:Xaa-Pro aminopeptidase